MTETDLAVLSTRTIFRKPYSHSVSTTGLQRTTTRTLSTSCDIYSTRQQWKKRIRIALIQTSIPEISIVCSLSIQKVEYSAFNKSEIRIFRSMNRLQKFPQDILKSNFKELTLVCTVLSTVRILKNGANY